MNLYWKTTEKNQKNSRSVSINMCYEIVSDERIEIEVEVQKKETEKIVLGKIVSKDLETKKDIGLPIDMFTAAIEVARINKKRWSCTSRC